jgi:hypothetical protein
VCNNDDGGGISSISGICTSSGIGTSSEPAAVAPAGFCAGDVRRRLSTQERGGGFLHEVSGF